MATGQGGALVAQHQGGHCELLVGEADAQHLVGKGGEGEGGLSGARWFRDAALDDVGVIQRGRDRFHAAAGELLGELALQQPRAGLPCRWPCGAGDLGELRPIGQQTGDFLDLDGGLSRRPYHHVKMRCFELRPGFFEVLTELPEFAALGLCALLFPAIQAALRDAGDFARILFNQPLLADETAQFGGNLVGKG